MQGVFVIRDCLTVGAVLYRDSVNAEANGEHEGLEELGRRGWGLAVGVGRLSGGVACCWFYQPAICYFTLLPVPLSQRGICVLSFFVFVCVCVCVFVSSFCSFFFFFVAAISSTDLYDF